MINRPKCKVYLKKIFKIFPRLLYTHILRYSIQKVIEGPGKQAYKNFPGLILNEKTEEKRRNFSNDMLNKYRD